MHLIHAPLATPDNVLPRVEMEVDRLRLAKRLWRGAASDGVEFGFELAKPLQPGEAFFQTAHACYFIAQTPESLLEISLVVVPSVAAGIGWAIGNLHLELMADSTRLLTPDEKAVRRLLARLNVPFCETRAVFRPGRFARDEQNQTTQTHDLGPSHKH